MDRPMGSEEFWSDSGLVGSYSELEGALEYEADAVSAAVARASVTGAVDRIHVVGVGAGRELPSVRAAAPSAHLHAWDLSQPMVEACRSAVRRLDMTGVTVGRCDVAELDRVATDGPADVVIALGAVLGYQTRRADREAAMSAVRASLRPGGALAAVVQQRRGRPDWALWFAASDLVARARSRPDELGNRSSRHGSSSVRFHHFTRGELGDLLTAGGFGDVHVESLRQWSRQRSMRLPLRSPNPLVALATAR